jgi:predicted DNA-binding antitoxin AbrB/MazE fold protein
MPITVEAVYENGVLKPTQPLPFKEHERVSITVQTNTDVQTSHKTGPRGYGLIQWTGSLDDLDYLIEDVANDPLEGP